MQGGKTTKQSITHTDFVKLKILGIAGLGTSEINPQVLADRYIFVNNIDDVKKTRLEEYNVWYYGDSDRLKNFFTRANAYSYNTDPLYNENKKSYYWAVSSTEEDIKRTHSGHPRNMVDTMVSIMTNPLISCAGAAGVENKQADENLKKILKANRFEWLLNQVARPLTLVEGWGARKINWDSEFSEYPILLYYRADQVDFVYISNQIRAIIYRDYYQNEEGKNYVLYETRRIGRYTNPETGKTSKSLYIEKELYEQTEADIMIPLELTELPQLRDLKPVTIIEDYVGFLGYPSIFYHDASGENYGRSIFTGKTDIFDDLDQCFSQSANAVRLSTVHEYFNTLYLETDENGLPIQPDAFNRKYIKYQGMPNGDGSGASSSPVQVVQPNINFTQYAEEEQNLLLNMIAGYMSPSSYGIDVSKKNNASDTREKEKVTIFTRNLLLDTERDVMEHLGSDLLLAYELMSLHPGEIATTNHYDISVQYRRFTNGSFESRLEAVQTAWSGGLMSDELAIDMLYGSELSDDEKKKELQFIQEKAEEAAQKANNPLDPTNQGAFGKLGEENDWNDKHEKTHIDDLKEDLGIE